MKNLDQQPQIAEFWTRLCTVFKTTNVSEIANKLSKTEQAVYNWKKMKGLPDPYTLLDISSITGFSIHWLLTGDGPMKVNQEDDSKEVESEIEKRVTAIVHKELAKAFQQISQAQAQNVIMQASNVNIENRR